MFTGDRILCSRSEGVAALATLFVLGLIVGTALGLVGPSRSQIGEPSPPRPAGFTAGALRAGHPAEVLRVVDGDTFEARVRIWPGLEIVTKVRLRGIDAPEISSARCDQERLKAIAARDALRAILDEGDVGISGVALDKYGGRVLADASTRATPDVSAALLGAGHVRSYSGGRREPWC
jgi:endonuclease YncB( thermonuclease family)